MKLDIDSIPVPIFLYFKDDESISVNRIGLAEWSDQTEVFDLIKAIVSYMKKENLQCHYTVKVMNKLEYLFSFYRIEDTHEYLISVHSLDVMHDLLENTEAVSLKKKEWDYILQSIHDDILISDGQGKILKVSPSFEEIYGVSQKEVIGKTVFEMEEIGVFQPSVTAMVLKNSQKITMLQKNRYNRQIVVTATPVNDSEGNILKVISFSRDITDFITLKEQYSKLESKIERYTAELEELRNKTVNYPGVIGKTKNIQEVLKTINKVANFDANLLFTGESGVGKTLFARVTHTKSRRAKGPFIEINCGAIPENLLESELFGYESGSFTGAKKQGKIGLVELAHNGTLFLDEVSELTLSLQVKLLKVIQDKKIMRIGGTKEITVDFRLIAATNKHLKSLVVEKKFREDLFYRLNVITMNIPPLRERKDDIVPLSLYFIDSFNNKYGLHKYFNPSVLDILVNYSWPGNIRELENVIERAILTSDNENILEFFLPISVRTGQNHVISDDNMDLNKALESLEREYIQKAFTKYKTTVKVAEVLGISQPTAVRKIKKYIIQK